MARINEVVNRVRMEATTHGVDEQISKTKGLVNAQGELVRSSEALTQTTEKSVKGRLSLETPLQKLENRWDKQIMLQRRLMEVESQQRAAMANQPELVGRYGNVLGKVQQQLDHVTQSTTAAALAQQKAAQSMVIPDRVVTVAESTKNAYRNLKEELVPLFGIGQQYKRQVDDIRAAQAAGIITQQQGTAAIQRARAATHEQAEAFNRVDVATGKYINGTGLARHELINLSRQAQDVAVSLVSGQGLFTVLTQQGSQIADIFISTGATMKSFWGQVAAGAAFIARPLIVAGSTVAAFGVAAVTAGLQWASAQTDVSRALLGIGRASGVTLGDINKIAKQTSSAFGLSTSEAREFATELARTGRIGVAEITELAKMGKDVARVFGVDAVDAAKMLAQAMTSPKGAAELNQRLGFMDAAMQRQVESLFAQNKLMEAQQLLSAGIQKSVADVNKTVGVGSQIWTGLGNTVSNTWDKIGESINRAVGNVDITEQLISLQNDLQPLMERFFTMAPRVQIGQEGQRLSLQIEATQNKIRELNAELEKTAKASAEAKLNLQSAFAADLVRTVLPDLKGMEGAQSAAKALHEILKQINKEMMQGGESPLLKAMGMDLKTVQQAAQAAASAVKDLQENMAQQGRRVAMREQVREQFQGTGISADVGIQLNLMKDQLAVAQAVTGQERLRAQEVATYNQLRLEGKSIEEAAAVASAQRGMAQAQINAQAQLTLLGLRDQFSVASAVTGQEKMAAQEVATRNNLIRQGVDASLAGAVAAQEHANAQAQINAQAQLTLLGLQDQHAVASAITGRQRMAAQEQATYNALVRQGVDTVIAGTIAAQERANAEAAVTAAVERQIIGLEEQLRLVEARTAGAYEFARVSGQIAGEKAFREGASANASYRLQQATEKLTLAQFAATDALKENTASNQESTSAMRSGGGRSTTQMGPELGSHPIELYNEASNYLLSQMEKGLMRFDQAKAIQAGPLWPAQFNEFWVPTKKAMEEAAEKIVAESGSVPAALDKLIGQGGYGAPASGDQSTREMQEVHAKTINRLIDLLPEEKQAEPLSKLLAQVKQQPVTLAREEMIKDLTDKIEQLKNSTDALNDTIEIDPLYSQGHGYVGIGYYTEGGRSSRIPLDPNTPPYVPDLPTTTPVLPPPTMPMDTSPWANPWKQPIGSQITPLTEEQRRYREAHPGAPMNFANGGSFMVGGSGGTDSQYIPMRLTPGEMIDVTPPGRNGGKPTVVNNIVNNFNFPPDRSYGSRRTQRQAREGYGRSMAVMH